MVIVSETESHLDISNPGICDLQSLVSSGMGSIEHESIGGGYLGE
jgi:hypothetical protein